MGPGERAVLALLAEGPAHGFAIAREMVQTVISARSGRFPARGCITRSMHLPPVASRYRWPTSLAARAGTELSCE